MVSLLQRASRAIKTKRSRPTTILDTQAPIDPQIPTQGHRREPNSRSPVFRSSSFVIYRIIQIFLALAILGGIIRLAFFDYITGDGDTSKLNIPLRLSNKAAYYLYIAVVRLTIALYSYYEVSILN